MSSQKRKAQKLRERKERLRHEKHERRSQPQVYYLPDDDEAVEVEYEDEDEPLPRFPSRFAAEQGLHDLHKLIAGREFDTADELNKFVDRAMKSGEIGRVKDLPRDSKEIARDLAYQAVDAEDHGEIERLARLAVKHDPECVDALRMLALVTATSARDQIAKRRNTLQVAERALGREFFEENRGEFWGILEMRPYMRARHDLATALLLEGKDTETLAHLEALLDLNPNGNQGVRWELSPRYLELGMIEKARGLMQRYQDDYCAVTCWCSVLERHLSGDLAGAEQALAKAREFNPHVEAYLAGGRLPPRNPPDQYSPRKPSEAAVCAKDLRRAWFAHHEAISWLKEQSRRSSPG